MNYLYILGLSLIGVPLHIYSASKKTETKSNINGLRHMLQITMKLRSAEYEHRRAIFDRARCTLDTHIEPLPAPIKNLLSKRV